MGDDALDPSPLVQLACGYWGAKVLLTANALGVFDVLAVEPRTADRLVESLDLHPRGVPDLLDALVSLGVLERDGADGAGEYRNTPLTDAFLVRGRSGYMGGLLDMLDGRAWTAWSGLAQALRTGQPQNGLADAAAASSFFDEVYSDPAGLERFLDAMTGASTGLGAALAIAFPWQDHASVTDVGTAQGRVPVQFALAHPHLRVTGFDLPPVEPVFRSFVARQGLADRVTFHAGDFWTDPLPASDVLVMGHILHDWSLDEKRLLIAKAHAALPVGGALVVYEALIDDDRRANTFGLLMSLNMLVETRDGFDFTGAQCAAWMRDAGFSRTSVEPLLPPYSMVIGIK